VSGLPRGVTAYAFFLRVRIAPAARQGPAAPPHAALSLSAVRWEASPESVPHSEARVAVGGGEAGGGLAGAWRRARRRKSGGNGADGDARHICSHRGGSCGTRANGVGAVRSRSGGDGGQEQRQRRWHTDL
jgi:hypothetical protein